MVVPRWYRRTATHWVISAKREETQARRLQQLIEDSASGRTIPPLTRPAGSGKNAMKKAISRDRSRR
ncbi:MAG TPA: YdeI/OmpD-associated family protein [Polyangiaceae bacterium]|nr:YdeI/OmpD-associated family protein [Polyangiaceae bacterium]